MRLALLFLTAFAAVASAQPAPEKEDLLYLVLADNLVPTEAATAQEQKGKKDEMIYVVPGAASPARTPLASPTFLLKVKELVPEKLQLYKLDVKNGHREIVFRHGNRVKNPEPLHVDIKHVGDNLVRLQVSDSLPNGEYSFTPEGSNDVFCFEVY